MACRCRSLIKGRNQLHPPRLKRTIKEKKQTLCHVFTVQVSVTWLHDANLFFMFKLIDLQKKMQIMLPMSALKSPELKNKATQTSHCVFLLSLNNTAFKPRLSTNSSSLTQSSTRWIPDQPEMIKRLIIVFLKASKLLFYCRL